MLLTGVGDAFRLVRIRSAAALAAYDPRRVWERSGRDGFEAIEKATGEYLAAMRARPDHWSSHYNLGNFLLSGGDPAAALEAYSVALRLEPGSVATLVNASMAAAQSQDFAGAETFLIKALRVDPKSAARAFQPGTPEGLSRGNRARRNSTCAPRIGTIPSWPAPRTTWACSSSNGRFTRAWRGSRKPTPRIPPRGTDILWPSSPGVPAIRIARSGYCGA